MRTINKMVSMGDLVPPEGSRKPGSVGTNNVPFVHDYAAPTPPPIPAARRNGLHHRGRHPGGLTHPPRTTIPLSLVLKPGVRHGLPPDATTVFASGPLTDD